MGLAVLIFIEGFGKGERGIFCNQKGNNQLFKIKFGFEKKIFDEILTYFLELHRPSN